MKYYVSGTNTNLFIAYYDGTNGLLKLIYNASPISAPAAWSSPITIDSQAGQYVKMAMDPSGNIHLAYFDSVTSGLKYAYLTPTFNGSGKVTGVTLNSTLFVDTMFTNGMYNSISIRDFSAAQNGTDMRPVIVTYSISYGGTKYALRISWPTTNIASVSAGTDPTTAIYTGSWETIAVLNNTPPGQSNTFVDTYGTTVGKGNLVAGYNGSYMEEANILGTSGGLMGNYGNVLY
jgi:hypothetical protein